MMFTGYSVTSLRVTSPPYGLPSDVGPGMMLSTINFSMGKKSNVLEQWGSNLLLCQLSSFNLLGVIMFKWVYGSKLVIADLQISKVQ